MKTEIECGDKLGCAFNDEVSVVFCPEDLEDIQQIFQDLAMKADNYLKQGRMRKYAEKFEKAHQKWHKEREEKDQANTKA